VQEVVSTSGKVPFSENVGICWSEVDLTLVTQQQQQQQQQQKFKKEGSLSP